MKLLLDTCVSGLARADLEAAGHDVLVMSERGRDPGDDEVLALAHGDGRVLVTLDKDFGELAVRHAMPHSGIARLVGFRGSQQGAALVQALESHSGHLLRGAIITVEPGRVRVRE